MPAKIDITGRTFGRATVLRDGPRSKSGRRTVECACSCGKLFVCDPRELLKGKCQSCGCYQRDAVAEVCRSRTTHGMTGTTEYNTWIKIKSRCHNEQDRQYADYGARGVSVCAAWLDDFDAFYRDMGPKPFAAASIDRIDVNGNYEPGNCRWADAKTQSRNKRRHRTVQFEGRTMPLSEACELAGVNYRSSLYRLNRGLDWMPLPPGPDQGGEK